MDLVALRADLLPTIGRIGQEILHRGNQLHELQMTHKAAGDVSTQVDLWAEQALREELSKLMPQAQFMGEESDGGAVLSEAPTWIVDPIDGTANFARGYPQWSVSVALAVDRLPVLGVIADPQRDELFYAVRGQGAWLRDRTGEQRLQCAAPRALIEATVATVFPKPHAAFMEAYLQEFSRIIRSCGQVRRSGSMALELAYLAAGRVDAFWERGMQAWDAAAGIVLLEEAGAQIAAVDGKALLSSGFLAAGSASGLDGLLKLLQK
jgi:myo-inositol-1(or 4)-monophosphatase